MFSLATIFFSPYPQTAPHRSVMLRIISLLCHTNWLIKLRGARTHNTGFPATKSPHALEHTLHGQTQAAADRSKRSTATLQPTGRPMPLVTKLEVSAHRANTRPQVQSKAYNVTNCPLCVMPTQKKGWMAAAERIRMSS